MSIYLGRDGFQRKWSLLKRFPTPRLKVKGQGHFNNRFRIVSVFVLARGRHKLRTNVCTLFWRCGVRQGL